MKQKILFLADEITALCPKTTYSLRKQHQISKVLKIYCKNIILNLRDRVRSKSSQNKIKIQARHPRSLWMRVSLLPEITELTCS